MPRLITLCALFVCLLPLTLYARSSFKAGYVIDNSGAEIPAEIQERNWYNNPTTLTYRIAGAKEALEASISDLRGFGLTGDGQRFVRAAVDIEQTPDEVANLNYTTTPEFLRDTVWLRQFVEGEADLFYWSGKALKRFFYRVENRSFEPLISRSYRVGLRGVQHDNRFRATLVTYVSCEAAAMPQIGDVAYTKQSLIEYFMAYNACRGEVPMQLTTRKGPSPRFAFRFGGELRTAEFVRFQSNGPGRRVADFGTSPSLTLGFEAEQALEFTNRRWSVFMGVNYRKLEASRVVNKDGYYLDQHSIAIPLGLRLRGFDLGSHTLYVMGGLIAEIPLRKGAFRVQQREYRTGLNYGGTLGVGARFGKHLELEGSYRFRQDMLTNYVTESLFETATTLTLAYRM